MLLIAASPIGLFNNTKLPANRMHPPQLATESRGGYADRVCSAAERVERRKSS
jgi:hypothetical protein